jgi:hypothetical protein
LPRNLCFSLHQQLEEFRKAKERRAVMAAAAAAAQASARAHDSFESTMGTPAATTPPSTSHNHHPASSPPNPNNVNNFSSRGHSVADLESLDAFGLFTPPRRDPISASAAAAAAAASAQAQGSGATSTDGNQQNQNFVATPDQDPFVDMLTRQVRSLQREKAEMGEENADVMSLEDLVGSLESLLEGGGVDEGVGAAGTVEMVGGAGDRPKAAGLVEVAAGRHSRGGFPSPRSKDSYMGEWLDTTVVALGLDDIERSFEPPHLDKISVSPPHGSLSQSARWSDLDARQCTTNVKRRSAVGVVDASQTGSATEHQRHRVSGAGFVGIGDSPLDHRYKNKAADATGGEASPPLPPARHRIANVLSF